MGIGSGLNDCMVSLELMDQLKILPQDIHDRIEPLERIHDIRHEKVQ